MSYVVLARKYRPRSFAEMVGQDHVVKALTHALEQQRLHHAYLFTGTRGIGKTTVSRILAKSLNCTGPDGSGGITATPCGVCSACREIDADRYIDYVELDAASNRSIDEIRELIERAAYKPTVGRFKVFMIDEAHQLTKDAFNALLKTLEEPPEYLKFVLATTDPEKMLPTVLSRCLQFNLRPMAPQTVAEHLAQVLQAEAVPAEPGALRLLSRAARGSMRDGLSLTDQAIAYGGGQLREAAVRAMLGTVDRAHADRLVQGLAARDGRAVLAECDALRGQGLSAAGTLDELARLLQQMAVVQVLPDALDPADPDTEAACRLAGLLAPDETQLLYSICLQGRAELNLAPDEYAGLVMVLLRFLAFPAEGGAPQRLPQPDAAGAKPVDSPSAPPPTAAPAPVGRPAQPLRASQADSTSLPVPTPPVPVPPAVRSASPVAVDAPAQAPAAVSAPVPAAKPAGQPVVALAESSASSASAPRAASVPAPASSAAAPAAPPAPAAVRTAAAGGAAPVAAPAPTPAAAPVRAARQDDVPPWMDEEPPPDWSEAGAQAQAAEDQDGPASPRPSASRPAPAAQRPAGPARQEPTGAAPGSARSGAGPAAGTAVASGGRPEVSAAAPLASRLPALPSAPVAVPRTPLGDRWARVVADMNAAGSISALVRELAMQAQLTAVTPLADGQGEVWQLTVEREPLRSPGLADKLLPALKAATGQAQLRLEVQAGVALDSPARRDAEQVALRQAEAERLIHDDPLVQSVLAQFGTARIVAGSIKPL